MAIHKLTTRKVNTAEPGKHEDGGGLRLVVESTGSRRWVVRVTLNKKRREYGLGGFPDVSLADARKTAAEYRVLAKQGIDPAAKMRSLAKEPQVQTPTFISCAARYIKSHRHGWRNAKHGRQWVSTIKTYAKRHIGKMKVNEISTQDVLSVLQPIWTSKNETAKRLQGRIESILDYAAAHNYRDSVNPARWRGHLDKLLPKPSKIQRVRHHPAMPYTEIQAFWSDLAENDCTSSRALQLLILTATRTSEVLNATWAEFDLNNKVWTIPENRMKAGREHRVPLSSAALQILKTQPRVVDNLYVFPGAKQSKPLSNMALLSLMRGMGYGKDRAKGEYVPHGFRSTFRDWSGEVSSYPRDVAEMALAHTIENKVEAAYRRGDLFEKRRQMMQDWADYIVKKAASG